MPPKPSSYLPNIYDLDTTAEALPPPPPPGMVGGREGMTGSPLLHNIRPLYATHWSSQLPPAYPGIIKGEQDSTTCNQLMSVATNALVKSLHYITKLERIIYQQLYEVEKEPSTK